MRKKVIDADRRLCTDEFEFPMDDGSVLMAYADIGYHVTGYMIPGTHDDPPETEWEVDCVTVSSGDVKAVYDENVGYEPIEHLSKQEFNRLFDICRGLAEVDFQRRG